MKRFNLTEDAHSSQHSTGIYTWHFNFCPILQNNRWQQK